MTGEASRGSEMKVWVLGETSGGSSQREHCADLVFCCRGEGLWGCDR